MSHVDAMSPAVRNATIVATTEDTLNYVFVIDGAPNSSYVRHTVDMAVERMVGDAARCTDEIP